MDAMKEKVKSMSAMDYGEIAFMLVTFILTAIIIFSLMGVDTDKITDDSTKSKVKNSQKSSYGLGVMLIILAVLKFMSKFGGSSTSTPKAFLRYF